jgi:DNA-binding NarL/FixJ family response regulator
MATQRTILMADDHALVRAGIRALLESLPGVHVVGETGDGLEAVEIVRRNPPDVILLDVTMPGMNGFEAAARIVQLGVPTRVLMISMHASPDYAARAFAAGALGYLNKDAAFEELSEAIDRVCAGQRYLCRAIDADLVQQHEQRAGHGASGLDALTPRQRQILQLVAEGLGTRQIAERLFLSVKTVETHRAQLMERIGIHDIPGLVRFAIRHGLLPPEGT